MSLMKMQKNILSNIVEKIKNLMNLKAVNFRNVDEKKLKEKNTSHKFSVELDPYKINH